MRGWKNEMGSLTSEVMESADEASDGVVTLALIEVARTKIAIRHAVAEHEVGGGEHRSGNGQDRLLGPTPCLEAQELGMQVAGLDA